MNAIRRELFYPFTIEQVWSAISSQAALSEWLMETDFEPVVGRSFSFRTKPVLGFDGHVTCEVLVVEPPHRLVYSWKGGPLKMTKVSFKLEQVDQGTKLIFEHSGFSGLPELVPRFILGMGWRSLLKRKLAGWIKKSV